jgi:putative transposase
MPAPYSLDLRTRVVSAYKNSKKTLLQISQDFSISAKTVHRWVQKYEKDGNICPITGYQNGHSHVISDLEEFKNLVENNDFSTVQEIVDHIGKGSTSSIERALKKIVYVKKKRKIL